MGNAGDGWPARLVEAVADFLNALVMYPVPLGEAGNMPLLLLLILTTGVVLTLLFGFVNCRCFVMALRTAAGRYSRRDDPGQITHFQALSTALSNTVGLGNIAGVAIAIGLGGPGAIFWMILMGFFGMTTKFCECTLGVRYRRIGRDGTVLGGPMHYLRDGFGEIGWRRTGIALSVVFALFCALSPLFGTMFQINQTREIFTETYGLFDTDRWIFGLIVTVVLGMVILGGITRIATVTRLLVPFMFFIYLGGCAIVLCIHLREIPAAFEIIISHALTPGAAGGGMLGALYWGVLRAIHSNEAGVGTAAIAHSAVRTTRPASEGLVSLIEPFLDTVVICTATALVIVVTGMWQVNARVDSHPLGLYRTPGDNVPVDIVEAGTMVERGRTWFRMLDESSGTDGWRRDDREDPATLRALPSFISVSRPIIGKPTLLETWTQVRTRDREDFLYIRIREGEPSLVAGANVGIWRTSQAFKAAIGWFPHVLSIAVLLFAFSTVITGAYYGEQGLLFLTGNKPAIGFLYKLLFCCCTVMGTTIELNEVRQLTDVFFLGKAIANLAGIWFLLSVVQRELRRFREHVAATEAGRRGRG